MKYLGDSGSHVLISDYIIYHHHHVPSQMFLVSDVLDNSIDDNPPYHCLIPSSIVSLCISLSVLLQFFFLFSWFSRMLLFSLFYERSLAFFLKSHIVLNLHQPFPGNLLKVYKTGIFSTPVELNETVITAIFFFFFWYRKKQKNCILQITNGNIYMK